MQRSSITRNIFSWDQPLTRFDRLRLWMVRHLMLKDERIMLHHAMERQHAMTQGTRADNPVALLANHTLAVTAYLHSGRDIIAEAAKRKKRGHEIWGDDDDIT